MPATHPSLQHEKQQAYRERLLLLGQQVSDDEEDDE